MAVGRQVAPQAAARRFDPDCPVTSRPPPPTRRAGLNPRPAGR